VHEYILKNYGNEFERRIGKGTGIERRMELRKRKMRNPSPF
jgi:hypothetical protein